MSQPASQSDAFGAVRHGYAPSAPHQARMPSAFADNTQDGALPSVRASFQGLIDQGKATVRAEANVVKQRAALVADGGKVAALSGTVAVVFALLALIALTVGLLLIAMQTLGPWLGMVIVVGALLAIAAVFGLRVKTGVRTVKTAFTSDGANIQ